MGTFIAIEIKREALTAAQTAAISAICPVDIFVVEDGGLAARPEQEDECVLCELCLRAAPLGAITIRKSYKPEALVSGPVPG